MKKLHVMACALLALCSLSSCTTRLMDLTILSTKNIDLNKPEQYTTIRNARVSGKDTVHIISFIPLGFYPSAKEAADRAVEKCGSDAVGLSNPVFYESSWWIPLIYGQINLTVEGDPIYERAQPAAATAPKR